jgi:hypothetical protein
MQNKINFQIPRKWRGIIQMKEDPIIFEAENNKKKHISTILSTFMQ